MVDKGNVDKHRQSYSGGVKAVEEQKWGRDTARERYGALKQPDTTAVDHSQPQKLGDANNLQDPSYNNTHRADWVRGFGKGGIESAETKPGYGKITPRRGS
jgi:hypothetical protein